MILKIPIVVLLVIIPLSSIGNLSNDASVPSDDAKLKYVIIRDDDIEKVEPSLEWLSNIVINKNIKITYAVTPIAFQYNDELAGYLNSLDRKHFEIATHGYKHEIMKNLSYEEQYNIIRNGTKIIKDELNLTPYTFVPPFEMSDINTIEACKALGYNSISTLSDDSITSLENFAPDFYWEKYWYNTTAIYDNFENFKSSFDNFYNSSDKFYVILMHHTKFRNSSGNINKSITDMIDKSIDYMKNKNVTFVTIEDAYQSSSKQKNTQENKLDTNHYLPHRINKSELKPLKIKNTSLYVSNCIFDDMYGFNDTIWHESNGYCNEDTWLNIWCADHIHFSDGIMDIFLDDKPSCKLFDPSCIGRGFASGEIRTINEYGYGFLEGRIKAAKGKGMVTSLFIYDDNSSDEIDIEILGEDPSKMWCSYWHEDAGRIYGESEIVDLGFDASKEFHIYAFEWSENSIKWYVDGRPAPVFIYNKTNAKYPLPTHPGRIMASLWASGANDFKYNGSVIHAYYDWIRYTPYDMRNTSNLSF